MTSPEQQRALRRRRRRERQAVVFGSLVAGLAVVGLGAVASYTGAVELPFLEREFASPPPAAVADAAPAPCPAEGALPVAYSEVQVNVLNGADVPGLAGQTVEQLTARGFTTLTADNYPTTVGGTGQVLFGAQGVAAAYTLAAHLNEPILVLDLREDATVDLVLGTEFTALAPAEAVPLDPEVPLEGTPTCLPLEEALTSAVPAPAPAEGEGEGEVGDPVQTEPPTED